MDYYNSFNYVSVGFSKILFDFCCYTNIKNLAGKNMKLFIMVFVLLINLGCVSPGGGGGLLVNYTTSPLTLTNNPVGEKTGSSSAHCFFALICFGDAGIYRAARNGNIQKISSVDYTYVSFLYFLYNSTTVIVSGN